MRALDVNLKAFGENNRAPRKACEWWRGCIMAQGQWDKAEPYLVRAVKGSEAARGGTTIWC